MTGDTAPLLDQVTRFVARYVVLPGEAERTALSLFVLHTWAFDAAHATPYLVVVSPERRTGKTRLLEVLTVLVREPWHATSPTEAVLFRKIAKDKPTLLLDEIDAIFGSASERTEPVRAILNAGNRAGAKVPRCIGKGSELVDFPVFCAKVLAGIDTGRLPDTIIDRAIVIRMKRRHAGEPVDRLRIRKASEQAIDLGLWLEDWAVRHVGALTDAEPELPEALNDRAMDAWEPLAAIADLAGGEWSARARKAAVALSGNGNEDDATYGTQLLSAIRATMDGRDKIPTAELLEAINADEELSFGGWNDGKGINASDLARRLKPYDVRPRKIRDGEATVRGYRAADLRDAFLRYAPQGAEQAEHPEHGPEPEPATPDKHGDVPGVPGVPPNAGHKEDVPDGGANGRLWPDDPEWAQTELDRAQRKLGEGQE